MTRTIPILSALTLSGLMAATAGAQALSPPADTTVTIKGKKITIKYSAPSMRGRKIFGEGGIEPYNKVWRTGANEATSLETEGDLTIAGLKVPKGSYTLFTYIKSGDWQLIVNKQTGQGGLDYDEKQDLGRVKMIVSQPPAPIEKFKITLASPGANKGTLTLAWENTVAAVPFTVQ